MKKIAIAVLVGLAVLFAAGISLPLGDGGGSVDPADPRVDWLRDLLVRERRLQSDELAGDCVRPGQDTLRVDGLCRLTVAGSRHPRRRALLELGAGPLLEVFVRPAEGVPWTRTLASGDTLSVDVYRDGGALRLRCNPGLAPGGSVCRVRLR